MLPRVAGLVIILFGFSTQFSIADSLTGLPCTDPHLATANEAAAAPGIVAGVTYVCPSDARMGISSDTGAARLYLKSLPRSGSALNNENIDKLNGAFSFCAARFLQAFQSRYGAVQITSAYRSPAFEATLCKNNPACGLLMNHAEPNGNHQRGLAVDVVATAGQKVLYEFARQNPQFGVCFPFTGEGGGFSDTVHMILAGIPGNETKGPGCYGVTRACDGSNFISDNLRTTSSGSLDDAAPETSDLGSLQDRISLLLRQMLMQNMLHGNMQAGNTSLQRPAAYTPPGSAHPTIPQTPATFSAPTYPSPPSPSTSVYATLPPVNETNAPTYTPPTQNVQSIDTIFSLVNSIPTAPVATATAISLYADVGDYVQLTGAETSYVAAPTNLYLDPSLQQPDTRTFISDDLSEHFVAQPRPAPLEPSLLTTLGRLQEGLSRLRAFLERPFIKFGT